MKKDEKLLNDFEDNYLKSKKKRILRYLLISTLILIVIIAIIILIVIITNRNKNSGTQKTDENYDRDSTEGNENQENQKENENEKDTGKETEKETEKESDKEIEPSNQCPEIKYITSESSQDGYASRYWDCCKPSCSWTENAGSGNEAIECDKYMNIINDKSAQSKCQDGPSTTCLSQIPFVIDGCDNLGFAFAAVPGGSGDICGRCFELIFTGYGKYETKKNHQMLKYKNKKLIVMASNIGYDVTSGQFDVLIPGGGVGAYNACDDILGTNIGRQYGGLLSDCEEEVGWNYDDDTIYNKRKECLTNKCNSVFADKEEAKKGCLFLADFLEAAGNPLHTYKEIECPQELKDKY